MKEAAWQLQYLFTVTIIVRHWKIAKQSRIIGMKKALTFYCQGFLRTINFIFS